jgi:hypothetical protein
MLTIGLLALLHIAAPPGGAVFREPQLAASRNLVALAFGSGNSIFVSTSTDKGRKFSPPVKVYEGGIVPLSRHRGPRVVISRGTIIVTAVVGHTAEQGLHAHGMAADGDLIAWRSTDGGKTWRGGVRINDVPAAAREGLHTLAADGHGKLFSAWLDLRAKGTRLYGAYSNDFGATWSPNILIYASPDGTICQCCHPSAAFSQTGELAVMWRNCLGESRDLYLAEAKDGQHFGTPQKLGNGTWMINACPWTAAVWLSTGIESLPHGDVTEASTWISREVPRRSLVKAKTSRWLPRMAAFTWRGLTTRGWKFGAQERSAR